MWSFLCGAGDAVEARCLTVVVFAGGDEMESNLTRARTRSAMVVKRANGQRVGMLPTGCDFAQAGRSLIAYDQEAGTIERIRAARARGMRLERLAMRLTDDYLATKAGRLEPLDALSRCANALKIV